MKKWVVYKLGRAEIKAKVVENIEMGFIDKASAMLDKNNYSRKDSKTGCSLHQNGRKCYKIRKSF